MVKRYVIEEGAEKVQEAYAKALQGEAKLAFSVWNIGEALGVLDIYQNRKWLNMENYRKARGLLIAETLRLIKLGIIKTIHGKDPPPLLHFSSSRAHRKSWICKLCYDIRLETNLLYHNCMFIFTWA